MLTCSVNIFIIDVVFLFCVSVYFILWVYDCSIL